MSWFSDLYRSMVGKKAVMAITGIILFGFVLVHMVANLKLYEGAYRSGEHAGRAYAAYGGVYIVASLLWLWLAEGKAPDTWDLVGGGLALLAAAVILFAPRPA